MGEWLVRTTITDLNQENIIGIPSPIPYYTNQTEKAVLARSLMPEAEGASGALCPLTDRRQQVVRHLPGAEDAEVGLRGVDP